MRLRKDPERLKSPATKAVAGPSPGESRRNPLPTSVSSNSILVEILSRLFQSRAVSIAVLVALTFFAYWPCLRGDFVWDDDAWTLKLRPLFQNAGGLAEIWTNLTALQQYYPLSATSFWLDYHLWGFSPSAYHVENVLLHLAACGLFWKLLTRLKVPAAGLAAGILALHPLMVESVGWITERKNILSLALYLAALLAYGRFTTFWNAEREAGTTQSSHRWQFHLIALILFVAAYLAKATAFSLPAVLVLIAWWKQGRLRFRQDLLPTLPFWVISIGLGLTTSWLERTHVGARGPDWDIPFLGRCLIAGRALWFYVGKLLWPVDLCFIYPRWQLNPHSIVQWLWPAAVVVVVGFLWATRARLGRGPLAAVLFYAGTLFPLLGFLNGYFMRYSFVCDHWAYLSSLGIIALAAASLAYTAELCQEPQLVHWFTILLLPLLAVLTWRNSALFADSETLYRKTLALNPNADLAHNNLGLLLAQAGELDEALPHLERAVELRPSSAHAHNNLANALRAKRQPRLAAAQYELSLQLEPNNANTCNNLALLLATSSDASVRNGARAIELAQRARDLTQGRNPVVLATLAAAYAESGRFKDAISTIEEALDLAAAHPNSAMTQALKSQLHLYQTGIPFREPVEP